MKTTAAALLASLLLCVAAFGADAPALVREGNDAYAAGRYDEALERYKAARVEAPRAGEVRYNLGAALSALGKDGEALGVFSEADPEEAPALAARRLLAKGVAQAKTGDLEGAFRTLEDALGATERPTPAKAGDDDFARLRDDVLYDRALVKRRLERMKRENEKRERQQQQKKDGQQDAGQNGDPDEKKDGRQGEGQDRKPDGKDAPKDGQPSPSDSGKDDGKEPGQKAPEPGDKKNAEKNPGDGKAASAGQERSGDGNDADAAEAKDAGKLTPEQAMALLRAIGEKENELREERRRTRMTNRPRAERDW